MNGIKIITISLIIVLIILTLVTVFLLLKNRSILLETFFVSNHKCPPYTADHTAKNSFSSKSKGWCATADFADLEKEQGLPEGYAQSKEKCPPNYYRISGEDSINYNSKSWCQKNSN
jgi:hypothetical protein